MKPTAKNWMIAIIIILVILIIPSLFNNGQKSTLQEVPLSSVVERSRTGEIFIIVARGEILEVSLASSDHPTEFTKLPAGISVEETGIDTVKTEVIIEEAEPARANDLEVTLIPVVVITANFAFLVIMLRHNFSRQASDKILWMAVMLLGGLVVGPALYYFIVYRKNSDK